MSIGSALTPGAIEQLPKWLLCVPLVIQWLWLAIRFRSLTLPSVVNPEIETGGLAGESKLASLARIEADHAAWVAHAVGVGPGDDPIAARRKSGLDYPVIAKPDIGWCGYGVWLVKDDAQLAAYAQAFPSEATFLLQRYLPEPNEAGLMYVRRPGAERGRLTAVTFRHSPHVVGDGVKTVLALIAGDARTSGKADLYHAARGEVVLRCVPAMGEYVPLTIVSSLRVGSRYEDATALVTAALEDRVEAIARSLGAFHFGRFDVRFESVEAVLEGRFSIIEVNGAGSEAIQFWDPKLSLREAFAGVFAKQRLLFELGASLRAAGARPIGPKALGQAWLRQQRLIARYPASN